MIDEIRRSSPKMLIFWLAYSFLVLGGLFAFVKGIEDGTWLKAVIAFKEYPIAIPLIIVFGFSFNKLIRNKHVDTILLLTGATVLILLGAAITNYIGR